MYAAAFSGRTLLEKLEVTYSNLHVIYTNALLSATNNLSIQHSRFVLLCLLKNKRFLNKELRLRHDFLVLN